MQIQRGQLLLDFDAAIGAEDFVAATSNAAARLWLARAPDWPADRLVLCGSAGAGKSHLARLWLGPDGALLHGASLPALSDHRCSRIVVDAADSCHDEPALLHLLNASAEAKCSTLLLARTPPAHWTIRLPDLASRLRAAQIIAIDPPDDDLLRAILARQLAARQLLVPQPVQDWLLARLPRTGAALQAAVARLNAASLARQRPITRPLAADCLAEMLGATTDDEHCMMPDAGSSQPPPVL